MVWEEYGIQIVLAAQGFTMLLLWSVHEKVTQLETERKNCAFCQTDTSMIEVERMKRHADVGT